MSTLHASNLATAGEDSLRLRVLMAPTTQALARLLLVVRGRGARVLDLRWQAAPEAGEGTATLLLRLDSARHSHLQAAVERSVDVTSIVVL